MRVVLHIYRIFIDISCSQFSTCEIDSFIKIEREKKERRGETKHQLSRIVSKKNFMYYIYILLCIRIHQEYVY